MPVAADIRSATTYVYLYRVSVSPTKSSAAIYKGQIQGYLSKFTDKGDVNFEFHAPNDETALSWLLGQFIPGDKRPLQSPQRLASARTLVRLNDFRDQQIRVAAERLGCPFDENCSFWSSGEIDGISRNDPGDIRRSVLFLRGTTKIVDVVEVRAKS